LIIPAGKRREQVRQGGLKNETFANNPFSNTLSKSAITGMPDLQDQQRDDPAINRAVDSGGPDRMRGLDQTEHQNSPGMGMPGENNGANNGVSPFLTSLENPDDQQSSTGTIQTIRWIEQIVQGEGFVVNVDNSSGKTAITIMPDPQNPGLGFGYSGWKQVLERLEQVGVNPTKVEYKNNAATFVLESGGSKQVVKK